MSILNINDKLTNTNTVISNELELNKIYNEDCINGMKKIKNNSVDIIICDPPYNIGKNYDHNYRFKGIYWKEFYKISHGKYKRSDFRSRCS